ncbi:MAG: hypothetical protein NVSMB23_16550 [Myxococcales bacterium]
MPIAPPALPDASAAALAFEQLKPRLLALPADLLQAPRPDLRPLLVAAQALAQEAAAPALRARLARLPKEEFDPAHLETLPAAAAALLHARAQLDAALAPPADPQLPPALTEGAEALKERMLRVARYYFEDDSEVGKTLAALPRRRSGPGELAADLRKLAALYREREAALAADTRHYRAADATDAEGLAGEIGARLSAVGGEAIRAATGLLARAQALLVASHDEVRAAVLFLLRKEPGAAERFPSLTALPAARGRPRKGSAAPAMGAGSGEAGAGGPGQPAPVAAD